MIQFTSKGLFTDYKLDLNKRNNISSDSLKISFHAQERLQQRTSYNTDKQSIKQITFNARYKGIDLNNLKREHLNNDSLFTYFKSAFKSYHSTDILRIYGEHVYIFCGNKGRTLKTVVSIPQNLLRQATCMC